MQDEPKPEAPKTSGLPEEMTSQFETPKPVDPEARIENPIQGPVVVVGKKSHRKLWLTLALVLLLAAGAAAYFVSQDDAKPQPVQASNTKKQESAAKTEGLVLDVSKDYGNKYADGLLPVGDGKYETSAAKQGSVYACSRYAQNFGQDKGGAGSRGPWFTNNNTQYDMNKKAHVSGNIMWTAAFSNTLSGATRTIVTNDLPSHPTGVYPVAANDAAYAYDRNPNTIKSQSLTYALPASPTYSAMPNCMGGEVGVMLTGVALFNGFDAGGRDAGAWEVQDNCSGHPQNQGEYHYHTLSSCIKDISVKTVIGYALDGFPITGPTVGPNNILTTADLDECHGITSSYTVDGKTSTGYHYVMTQDFPYSLSCFRSKPIDPPHQAGTQPQAQPPRP
jgi:hypothetical protein